MHLLVTRQTLVEEVHHGCEKLAWCLKFWKSAASFWPQQQHHVAPSLASIQKSPFANFLRFRAFDASSFVKSGFWHVIDQLHQHSWRGCQESSHHSRNTAQKERESRNRNKKEKCLSGHSRHTICLYNTKDQPSPLCLPWQPLAEQSFVISQKTQSECVKQRTQHEAENFPTLAFNLQIGCCHQHNGRWTFWCSVFSLNVDWIFEPKQNAARS